MEQFTQLKCLYMEGNCLETMDGLENSTLLRSIYFQDNFIKDFRGLKPFTQLKLLNLTNNDIITIDDGILDLKDTLENLYLKNNKIGLNGLSDLQNLTQMKLIATMDIQSNRIKDENVLTEIFQNMNVKVLYFQNNEAVKSIRNYRKTMIHSLPTLTYLDERPVFEEERRFAEAFGVGGKDAEKEERKKWDDERKEKQMQYLRDFDAMIAKSRAKHRKDDGKDKDAEGEEKVDIMKEIDATLTDDQKQKIHDLAHSRSTTTEDYMSQKGDYLKNKEFQWKKKINKSSDEETVKPKKEFKPKDTDLVFLPDDVEDESMINLNKFKNDNQLNVKDMDYKELTNIYNEMRNEKESEQVLSENVRSDYRFNKNDENYDDMPGLEDVPEEMIKRDKSENLELNQNNNSNLNNSNEISDKSNPNINNNSKNINSKTKKKINIEEVSDSSKTSESLVNENIETQESELRENLLNELSQPKTKPSDDEFEFKSCTDDFKSCNDNLDSSQDNIHEYDEVECTDLDDLD
eukprot:Mrub_02053.p1 GENE.Mrub_02053~~Mrub_02053.p1  ORF type:complete len:572 (-),score=163.21 Mrub_02053:150-1706(-)